MSASFGRWQKVCVQTPVAAAGIFQIRWAQGSNGLIAYPTGRSAMAFYGGGDQMAAELERLRARCTDAEWQDLWIRYELTADWREQLTRHLDQFRQRFGAEPVLNSRERQPTKGGV